MLLHIVVPAAENVSQIILKNADELTVFNHSGYVVPTVVETISLVIPRSIL